MNITPKTYVGAPKTDKFKYSRHHSFSRENKLLTNNQTGPQDVNFKGLSSILYKEVEGTYDPEKILGVARLVLGDSVDNLYRHIEGSDLAKNLFSLKDGQVTFKKKSVLHLIMEGILYPVKTLPGDLLNGGVNLLKKVPPLRNWAESAYNSKFLSKMRQRSKIDDQVNSLRGVFETITRLQKDGKTDDEIVKELFPKSIKMFDVNTGNYNTTHERSLARIVSGTVPAFFLATDAYNLSQMCDGDEKAASQESKTRFRQEMSRVFGQSYLTLITMGAMQKYINGSPVGIMLNTGITVLITEMASRLMNGKSIKMLTPEEARKINSKENNNQGQETKTSFGNVSETKDKPSNLLIAFADKPQAEKVVAKVETKPTTAKNGQGKDPLLSFPTIAKACAASIAIGFSLKKLRQNPKINKVFEKAFEPFKNLYKKLTVNPNYYISAEDFEEILSKLKDAGFRKLVEQYRAIAEKSRVAEVVEAFKAKHSEDFDEIVKTLSGGRNNDSVSNLRHEGYSDVARIYEGTPDVNDEEKILSAIRKQGYEVKDRFISTREITDADVYEYLTRNEDEQLRPVVERFRQVQAEVEANGRIYLGEKNRKIKPLIDLIKGPFQFAWSAASLPYNITRKFFGIFVKEGGSSQAKSTVTDLDILRKSIDRIGKEALKKGYDPKSFKSFVQDNILRGFNAESVSNIANNELANLAKASATVATLWFLMADNHNMVMLKSNGEDKEEAQLKAKERFVQEMSRLFYQTLIISLFNNTFKSQYNSSLLGMSVITGSNTFISENLNRLSVGMPVHKHTKEELVGIEHKKENATGFARSYYDFMARLTGKKSLAEQRQAKQAKVKK